MTATGKLIREPWDELRLGEPQAFARQHANATFGIWVFIASEVLFFAAIFLLYAVTRIEHPDAFAAASRETNFVYGTLNTAILLTSGLTAAVASRASEHAALRRLTLGCLCATLALGLAFIVVKGLEYREDIERHLVPGARFALGDAPAQLFFGFYWFSTSVHAIHLSIGLGLVMRLIWKGFRDESILTGSAQVEVAMLYWGFVDMVWIFLYPALYLAGRVP